MLGYSKKVSFIIGVFFVAFVTDKALAVDGLPNAEVGSDFYYELGGAQPIPMALNNQAEFRIGAEGRGNFGYSCGEFDLSSSLKNAFGDIEGLEDDVTNAATGAIQGLPMYLLQRWNPDAANLIKNQKFEIKQFIDLAIKSCEQMESEVLAGDDPYADWTSYGKSIKWGEESESNGGDVISAKKEVAKSSADVSFPWGDSEAGGPGDNPIEMNSDATGFGYNLLTGRELSENGAPRVSSRITTVFPTVEDAQAFVVDVVGETTLSGSSDGPIPAETPAKGLTYHVEECYTDVRRDFPKALNGDEEALAGIQGPSAAITLDLIEAIKSLNVSERSLAVDRLSGDICAGKTIEKAYMSLRILRAGLRETTVKKSPAYVEVQNSINIMDDEIVWLEREIKSRENSVSRLAKLLIEKRQAEITSAPLPSEYLGTGKRPTTVGE